MALKDKLTEFGLTEDQIAQALKELDGEYVTKGRFNEVNNELKGTNTQLEEANDKIKELSELDVEGIKKAAKDWEDKYKASEARREEDRLESQIEHAIRDAGGKNAKAIRGLLDIEALKKSKDRNADISAALNAVKVSDDYLFDSKDTEEKNDPKVNVVKGAASPATKMTREEINNIEDPVARRRAISENLELFNT